MVLKNASSLLIKCKNIILKQKEKEEIRKKLGHPRK
jgi:hypothetical protein